MERASPQGCVSDQAPHFTDLTKIDSILPPAVLSGNRVKNRSYVSIGRDQNGEVYEVPVYAPVDSTLTGITFYLASMQDKQGMLVNVEQYSLSFQVSCEVSYDFDHLWRLAESIAPLAATTPSTTTRNAAVQTSLSLNAGDLIGYTTGTIVAHNWDFVFANSSKRIDVVNLERYANAGDLRGLLHADCPYDYFVDDLRTEHYALFSLLPDGNDGCLVTHDKGGTIAGAWFNEPFVLGVTLGHEPGWGIVVGISAYDQVRVDSEWTPIWVNPAAPTYVDPKSITSEHCYEHLNSPTQPPVRHVYLELLSETELAVAFGGGSCPEQLPESYRVYYR